MVELKVIATEVDVLGLVCDGLIDLDELVRPQDWDAVRVNGEIADYRSEHGTIEIRLQVGTRHGITAWRWVAAPEGAMDSDALEAGPAQADRESAEQLGRERAQEEDSHTLYE